MDTELLVFIVIAAIVILGFVIAIVKDSVKTKKRRQAQQTPEITMNGRSE